MVCVLKEKSMCLVFVLNEKFRDSGFVLHKILHWLLYFLIWLSFLISVLYFYILRIACLWIKLLFYFALQLYVVASCWWEHCFALRAIVSSLYLCVVNLFVFVFSVNGISPLLDAFGKLLWFVIVFMCMYLGVKTVVQCENCCGMLIHRIVVFCRIRNQLLDDFVCVFVWLICFLAASIIDFSWIRLHCFTLFQNTILCPLVVYLLIIIGR